ncbi:MAG: PEP-CTERM sorting domain-containing protein, partial [Microcystis panniformis]
CRVRSLMWLLLLHRSIFGERTMHIDCSCGFKCDTAPPATTPEPSALVGLGAVVALGAGFKRRPTQADKN